MCFSGDGSVNTELVRQLGLAALSFLLENLAQRKVSYELGLQKKKKKKGLLSQGWRQKSHSMTVTVSE